MQLSRNETAARKEYNRLAPIYDLRWHNYINKSLSFLIDFAEIPSQISILDLACGTGELAKLLLTNNPQQQITGVDISDAMLAIAKNKLQVYPNIKLHNASVISLPYNSESFDLVVCANAFHYFEFPQLVLTEIQRVIKPDGRVIILDWCRDYIFSKIFDRLFKTIDPAYQQCYTQTELNQLLVAAGFDVIKNNKVHFGIIWELMAVEAILN
ncbi:MAG: methyltransferase domain-containing protein [Xenococcaceae cyanobacterium MO_188.B29]|nr:methyltransferase domain-containing protein [Xenococcaceae cyanobacterium MO_188.B29]